MMTIYTRGNNSHFIYLCNFKYRLVMQSIVWLCLGGWWTVNRGIAWIGWGHFKSAMKLISISNKYSVELQNMYRKLYLYSQTTMNTILETLNISGMGRLYFFHFKTENAKECSTIHAIESLLLQCFMLLKCVCVTLNRYCIAIILLLFAIPLLPSYMEYISSLWSLFNYYFWLMLWISDVSLLLQNNACIGLETLCVQFELINMLSLLVLESVGFFVVERIAIWMEIATHWKIRNRAKVFHRTFLFDDYYDYTTHFNWN